MIVTAREGADIATLEEARAAKAKLAAIADRLDGVQGVGITRTGAGCAVKLNLAARPETDVPAEIDGVPVVVEVVGRIRKR